MVHLFTYTHKLEEYFFLWDIESGSLHNISYVAFLCAKSRYDKPFEPTEYKDYTALDKAIVKEVIEEFVQLEKQGTLNAQPLITQFKKQAKDLKALCLHISHDCNMRCAYCFAGEGNYGSQRVNMPIEVGKKAVDFLIDNSGIKKNLEIDFFGGEPLINMDTVKATVDYARQEGIKHNKEFFFTITTNGVLLNKENIEYLNANMDNIVLSIDGKRETHNRVRRSVGGGDTYDKILANFIDFRKVRGDKKYYVRSTFTAKNLDFAEDILALNDYGFDQISSEPVVLPDSHELAIKEEDVQKINEEYVRFAEEYINRRKSGKWFNFFHFMLDLDHGPCVNKRLTGCGAGTEYMAVSPDGSLYPCHQFVPDDNFLIGNVFDGINNQVIRDKFAAATVLKKEHCTNCPAKYYCGGGCAANANNFTSKIDGQYKIGCELLIKRLEISLAIAFIEKTLN